MSLYTGFILHDEEAGTSRRFCLLFIVATLINIQGCEFVRHTSNKTLCFVPTRLQTEQGKDSQ